MKFRTYIRDKRSPIPKSEATSRVMSANKAKNTKPEIQLRRALWSKGIRGYRVHPKALPGKPDLAFTTKKVAVFINGCFWHRCPICNYQLPKTNTAFWEKKFERNVRRDQEKIKSLKTTGWKVLTIWECEIRSALNKQIEKLENTIYVK